MPKDSSFLEKLKKGMGIEIPQELSSAKQSEATDEGKPQRQTLEEKKEEPEEKEKKEKKPKKRKEKKVKKLEVKSSPVEEKKVGIKKLTPTKTAEDEEEWFEPEGKLAVDVYQTEGELIIQSAVAGVKVEDLDILIERDLISIRGVREKPFSEQGDYFTQECYWGPFSREIILPVEVDPNRIEASMKEGVLTIRIPKLLREKKRKIKVKKLA
jgi:HSP20 family molecular chaperone IbpA